LCTARPTSVPVSCSAAQAADHSLVQQPAAVRRAAQPSDELVVRQLWVFGNSLTGRMGFSALNTASCVVRGYNTQGFSLGIGRWRPLLRGGFSAGYIPCCNALIL